MNPGTALLPEPLEFLGHYFGPPVNSWLLPPSVIGLVGIAGWRFWRARQSTEPFARQVAVLLGVLFALAALEHALLGVSWRVPLWDPFLHAR